MSFEKMSNIFRNKNTNGTHVLYADVSVVVKSDKQFSATDIALRTGEYGGGYKKHPDEQWPVTGLDKPKKFINFVSRGDTIIIPVQCYFDENAMPMTEEMKSVGTSPSTMKLKVGGTVGKAGLKIGYNCGGIIATNISSLSTGTEYELLGDDNPNGAKSSFIGKSPLVANDNNKLTIDAGNTSVQGLIYFYDELRRKEEN